MSNSRDFSRDFGIIPHDVPPPPQTVRASFSWIQIAGQYLGTLIMSGLGLGMGVLFAMGIPFPGNVPAAAVPLAGFGFLVYRATRNDYAWVELDGNTLRAKHLYTGTFVEREIGEIAELVTMRLLVRSIEALVVEAWLGRIRGFEIRFRDGRTPLLVSRADPAMRNAKELMEAVVYRMTETGEVDYELMELEGKPLIRRIHWKERG